MSVYLNDETGEEVAVCDLCDGPLVPIGALGRLLHLRCRNCGMEFSRAIEPDTDHRECPCGGTYLGGQCSDCGDTDPLLLFS